MLSAIEKAQSIQLSDGEIRHFCHGALNIVSYTDIDKYASMDELLGEHGACALLYETHRPAPNEHVGVSGVFVMNLIVLLALGLLNSSDE